MMSSRGSRILIFFILLGGLLLLISCPLQGSSKNFILYVAEFEVGPFRGTNAYKVYESLSPFDYDKIPFVLNGPEFKRGFGSPNYFLELKQALNRPISAIPII